MPTRQGAVHTRGGHCTPVAPTRLWTKPIAAVGQLAPTQDELFEMRRIVYDFDKALYGNSVPVDPTHANNSMARDGTNVGDTLLLAAALLLNVTITIHMLRRTGDHSPTTISIRGINYNYF